MNVLVTGASGFIGRHLCHTLATVGFNVVAATRSQPCESTGTNYRSSAIGDIGGEVNWSSALQGINAVVHLAARVHVMQDRESDPLASFRRVNVVGTEALLRHKAMRNVKRFVYLSTIKVNGEGTNDKPFTADDVPAPLDPYGQSKLEAERVVTDIGLRTGLETVIIRPPLVYGPGVGGNFFRLLQLIDKGVPLPFGSVRNLRSLVGIQNLCDLIRQCLEHPSAAGQRYLVSDDSDVSTPELVRLIAEAMGRPARLLPIPRALLNVIATIAGRSAELARLTNSLQVDIRKTRQSLQWRPPVSMINGIRSTVSWYQTRGKHAQR